MNTATFPVQQYVITMSHLSRFSNDVYTGTPSQSDFFDGGIHVAFPTTAVLLEARSQGLSLTTYWPAESAKPQDDDERACFTYKGDVIKGGLQFCSQILARLETLAPQLPAGIAKDLSGIQLQLLSSRIKDVATVAEAVPRGRILADQVDGIQMVDNLVLIRNFERLLNVTDIFSGLALIALAPRDPDKIEGIYFNEPLNTMIMSLALVVGK